MRSPLPRRRRRTTTETAALARRARRDIFVSYAREDTAFVQRLQAALAAAEKEAYVDYHDIPQWSEDWQAELYAQIDASDNVVVVVSPDSVASANVGREIARAVAQGKRLRPVLLRDVDDDAVSPALGTPQWIDFRDAAQFDARLAQLLAVLDTDVAWVERHTRFLLDANEWEVRGQDRSLLLGRSDLAEADEWLAGQAGQDPPPTELQTRFVLASRSAAARRQRITMGSVLTALAVSLGLTIFALAQRSQAITERNQATSRELAALSAAQLGSDPEASLRLALRSAATARTAQAEGALQQGLSDSHVRLALQTPRDPSPILAGDVTPDGRYAVTVHRDRLGRVWDLSSGRRVAVLRGHTAPLTNVDISADGRRVVTASRLSSSTVKDGTARVWELPSGRAITSLVQDASGVGSAVFSPDSRRILATTSVDSGDPAAIWDARTGRRLRRLGRPGESDAGAWSADGARVATIDQQGVRVWDSRTGRTLMTFRRGPDEFPNTLAFSPDGRRLAVGGESVAFIARLASRTLTRLPGSAGLLFELTSIGFCPDGSCLLTTSGSEATIRSLSGARITTLRGHTAEVTGGSISADGRYVLTQSADGTARLWARRSGAQLAVLRGHDSAVTGAQMLDDARRVLTTSADGTGRIWDPRVVLFAGHRDDVSDARVSPDGSAVLTGSIDATAKLWSAAGTPRRTLQAEDFSGLEHVQFSPDGRRLLTEQNSVTLWTSAGRRIRTFDVGLGYAAFAPDSKTVALAGDDAVARFDTERGRPLAALRVGTSDDRATAVFGASFSSDSRLLAAPGALTGAHVWNAREGGRSIDLRTSSIDNVALSPDGRRLLTAGDSNPLVRLWSVEDRTSVVLDRYPSGVAEARFSPDGKLVVTVSVGERVVRVHDAASREPLAVLRHENEVFDASFDPGSRLVLTASRDRTARVWEARSGRLVASFGGHGDTIAAAHFSPDGRQVVTAADDDTALLRTCDACLAFDDLVELARKRVTALTR